MNEKQAYSLREVCRICGTTRSALHGYDKVGLLHPSEKRGSGAYWFYDKDSISKLMTIEILTSVGYSRLEVKAILDSSHPETAFPEAIAKLERERKSIIAKICFLETLSKMHETSFLSKKSQNFCDQMQQCLDFITSFSCETKEDAEAFSLAFLQALQSATHF